jgi:hypothetical protein
MRAIGRLTAVFTGGLMLASVVGAIAARAAKQRIVKVDAPDADEIRLAAIFEPISFRSTASSFRGGSVDCWYGGGVIDLRGATLDPAGARLQVRAIFGGAQILIPETWPIITKVVGIGGVGDGRPRVDRLPDAPQLSIEGVALFGGFGVTSEISDEAVRGLDEAIGRFGRRKQRRSDGEPRVHAFDLDPGMIQDARP